jgi:hypothetical protein
MARAAPIELWQPRTLHVAMNLRGDFRPNLGEGDWTCPAPQLRSGRVMVTNETVRRVGIERCQSRIEAETRPAVAIEDRVLSPGRASPAPSESMLRNRPI